MSRVIANIDSLSALAGVSRNKEIRQILSSDPEQILRCIQEIALNTIRSNVPLTKREYKILRRSAGFIRRIGKKRLPYTVLNRAVVKHLKVIPTLIKPTLRLYKVTL
jgi:hypothetical protein